MKNCSAISLINTPSFFKVQLNGWQKTRGIYILDVFIEQMSKGIKTICYNFQLERHEISTILKFFLFWKGPGGQ